MISALICARGPSAAASPPSRRCAMAVHWRRRSVTRGAGIVAASGTDARGRGRRVRQCAEGEPLGGREQAVGVEEHHELAVAMHDATQVFRREAAKEWWRWLQLSTLERAHVQDGIHHGCHPAAVHVEDEYTR